MLGFVPHSNLYTTPTSTASPATSFATSSIRPMGDDYPSVTFPGLKRKEMAEFGEYRTRRRVLEAYDRLQTSRRVESCRYSSASGNFRSPRGRCDR